ncbi:MFS transporter [Streptomyces sp. NPDC058964]|uniref:MFS transporter n=1 Tax=Streptomyces sp. NPDC058964 TaxID=3346681 RepID=UPI00369A8958
MGPAPAGARPVPLRRQRAFVLLCGEQIAGSVGRQVTALAVALLAVTGLHAGPFAAAAVLALTYLPGALLSPFAGVLVDRVRLRRLLVAVTAAQALVVGSVPLAAAVGGVGRTQLYGVAVLSGALTFTLSVALQAALPRVVGPERLLAANSALTGARTTGQIGGPALGGVLVGLLGPAPALLAGAAAYAVEALLLLALPGALNDPPVRRSRESPAALLRAGLTVVRAEPRLRLMVLAGAGLNLGSGAAGALFVYYATRDLGLPAWQLGTSYAVHSAATMAGVLLAGRLAGATGLWSATRICALPAGGAVFLVPAASLGPAFPLLLAYQLCYGLAVTVWAISMTTLQQLATPAAMQGRVAGFVQAALLGTVPVGALAGGALAAELGNVPVLLGSAAVALLAATALWAPGVSRPAAGAPRTPGSGPSAPR